MAQKTPREVPILHVSLMVATVGNVAVAGCLSAAGHTASVSQSDVLDSLMSLCYYYLKSITVS